MRPSCCICMETIHASSSSSDGNSVSATECGHVFHDVCLRRWLTTSNSCPTCRKQLHDEKIVKLFLDGADLLPDGCIRNEGGPLRLIQRQLCVARSQLEEAAAVEKRQAEEAHALRGNVRRLEGVARTYNSKYVNMMRENGRLRSQLRYLREEVRDRRILRRENSALQNELCSKERQLAISEEIRKRMDHAMSGLRVQLDQREALLQQQMQQIQALQKSAHHHAEFEFQSIQWPLPSWSDRSDDSPQRNDTLEYGDTEGRNSAALNAWSRSSSEASTVVSRMTILSEGTVDREDNLKNSAIGLAETNYRYRQDTNSSARLKTIARRSP